MKLRLRFLKENIFLILILILGSVIRLYGITKRSLWSDEILFIFNAQNLVKGVLSHAFAYNKLYVHDLFLWIWIKIFGIGDFAVRLPSVIFGVLSIFMIYKIGKLAFTKKVGLISALFLSISHMHIFFSQDATQYSLFIMMTTISYYYFLKFLKEKRYKWNYIISTVLLPYIHIMALLYVIPQLLFLFVKFDLKTIRRRFSQIFIIYSIAFIPVIVFIILKFFLSGVTNVEWIQHPEIFGSNQFSLKYILANFAGDIWVFLLFIALLTFSLYKKKEIKTKILFVFWLFLPIFLSFIYSSLIEQSYFVIRYFVPSQIPLYILLSSTMMEFRKKISYPFIAILCIYLVLLIPNVSPPISEDWRGAARFLKEQNASYIITGFPKGLLYYYDRDCFSQYDLLEQCMKKDNLFYPENISSIYNLKDKGLYFILRTYEFTEMLNDSNVRESIKEGTLIIDFKGLVLVQIT